MKEITGHTQVFGVLGSPISHSISPQMHNEAFRQLNMDCVYLAFEVDENGTKAAAATAVVMADATSVQQPEYKYVTLDRPFVYAIVDNTTKLPLFIGAVNTID